MGWFNQIIVRRGMRIGAMLLFGASWPTQAQQQPMGTVATRDARVTGGLEVRGEQARLFTNASVTAYGRTAPIALARGGEVLVCSTSDFHLLRSGTAGALIFGLDRGAFEVHSPSTAQDVILTPDLKFTPVTRGPLNVQVRVTPEGDTCVDNAGATAPVLAVSDPFSAAGYRILPGQHLLFVRGDLHRVVDHERSPCGCPVASQTLAAKNGAPTTPAQAAAAKYPFPQAQSEGLAPSAAPDNAAPVGTASSQVSTTFNYGEGQHTPPAYGAAPGETAAIPASSGNSAGSASSVGSGSSPGAASATSAGSSAAPEEHGLGGAVRRFFHRLFHPHA